MAENSTNRKLNEDLRKSYTHDRSKPATKPPQNRDTSKPQGGSNTQSGDSGKDE